MTHVGYKNKKCRTPIAVRTEVSDTYKIFTEISPILRAIPLLQEYPHQNGFQLPQ